MVDKQKILEVIQQSFPHVFDIEIIANKYVKCYEDTDLFGKKDSYFTNNLDYWLEKRGANENSEQNKR